MRITRRAGSTARATSADGRAAQSAIVGRKLVVKRFNKVRDIQKCHIVFVSASEKASVSDVLDRAKGTSWLTIGETEGFAQRGGIINLIKEEKRFRFEINVKSAKKAELKISSKLLKLAKIVED